jgi:hypothetical protein
MRWTLVVPVTNGAKADGKVVWSWRLDAGVKSAEAILPMTGTKKPDPRLSNAHISKGVVQRAGKRESFQR